MKLLQRVDALLNKVEGTLLVAFLAVMLIMAFLQVVLRNVFSFGFAWADILTRHFVLWIAFLGAALATSQERHISIDAFTRFLPERIKYISRVITNLFAAVICYYLMTAAIAFIQSEIEFSTILFDDIPAWYAQIIIPVGFGLLMFHFAVRVLLDLRSAITGASTPEKPREV
ncbi:MAG: TRAP transporter small permease [Ignavibacteriae bacterium]|nr:TRAP transporter small permease [Ignavibacteriota bacterium]